MLQDVEARVIPALPGLDWGLADTLAHHLNRDQRVPTSSAYRPAAGVGELDMRFRQGLTSLGSPRTGWWEEHHGDER